MVEGFGTATLASQAETTLADPSRHAGGPAAYTGFVAIAQGPAMESPEVSLTGTGRGCSWRVPCDPKY
jgi:hypothetical protein